MTQEVAIVAAGQARFGPRDQGPAVLLREALDECFGSAERGLEPKVLQEAFLGSMAFGGSQIGNTGPAWLTAVGLPGLASRRVENACASGGFALRDGYLAIRSGIADAVLVVGVEKMTNLPQDRQHYWLGVSGDTEWERLAGLTFAGTYALMAQRHMHDHGTTREQLASVAVKNHANGTLNPKAHFQRRITMDQVLGAPMVAHPLGLFDCCPVSDGAAAVVLAAAERAKDFTDTPVRILASAAAGDAVALHGRPDITRLAATATAAREAFRLGGIDPGVVDVAEVHDSFTIGEIMAVEDLGFCSKGEGGPFVEAGTTARDGRIPVNPSGGLKAKGHPLGATGVGQVVELFLQLRGQAGGRQIKDAEVGLAHNVGGSGASCAVHIFSR